MSKKVLKFLPEDFELLLQKIAKLRAKVIRSGQALGESTEQSSDTWHDNATYDVARMNFEIITRELEKLIEVRNSAQIIKLPKSNKKIQIGHVVIIEKQTTGLRQKVQVVGEMVR